MPSEQEPSPTVRYERSSSGVATITLNRPAQLNAITVEMSERLADALDVADADPEVGCVVLTGAGRGFCAGGDLGTLAGRDGGRAATEAELEAQTAARKAMHDRIPLRIFGSSKPTVAVLNGAAAGAGFSLALSCDIRIASATAKLTTGFANVGRSGDFGGTFFLPRLVGPSRSRELYFTSAVVTAERALAIGMVDHVHPPDDLAAESMALAERIARGPTQAIARMKEAFRLAEQGDLQRLLDAEARLQTASGSSAEGREFLARFLAARGS